MTMSTTSVARGEYASAAATDTGFFFFIFCFFFFYISPVDEEIHDSAADVGLGSGPHEYLERKRKGRRHPAVEASRSSSTGSVHEE